MTNLSRHQLILLWVLIFTEGVGGGFFAFFRMSHGFAMFFAPIILLWLISGIIGFIVLILFARKAFVLKFSLDRDIVRYFFYLSIAFVFWTLGLIRSS
jgi:hypothetical protein